MPEGPLGGPRLTNLGPASRISEGELQAQWRECPEGETEKRVCREIKKAAIAILEGQSFFAECQTLEDINSGQCHHVSTRVASEVPEATEMKVGDNDHFWIEYKGRHYDAEVPSGVDRWQDLPIFGRVPPSAMLKWARLAAIEGDEVPETIEDTVKEVDRNA